MKEISNGTAYRSFLYICLLLSGFGIIPIALRNYSLSATVVPIIILCFCFLAIIIIRPAYLQLRTDGNQLMINNNPFTEENLVMQRNEFGGFQFEPFLFETGRYLVFYRNTNMGKMQSKVYRITLLSKKKAKEFEEFLSNYQQNLPIS